MSINLATGEIVILDTGERFLAKPVPNFLREIVDAGGLVHYIKKKGLAERETE